MSHSERCEDMTVPRIDNPLAKASYTCQRRATTGPRALLSRRLPSSFKRQLRLLLQLSLDGVDLLVAAAAASWFLPGT